MRRGARDRRQRRAGGDGVGHHAAAAGHPPRPIPTSGRCRPSSTDLLALGRASVLNARDVRHRAARRHDGRRGRRRGRAALRAARAGPPRGGGLRRPDDVVWDLPVNEIRMLDHWDNVDVHPVDGPGRARVRRRLDLLRRRRRPRRPVPGRAQYARLLAVGRDQRASAINNVNVHAHRGAAADRPTSATSPRLADVVPAVRASGCTCRCSFAAPITLGGLPHRGPARPGRARTGGRAAAARVYETDPGLRRVRREGGLRGPARPVRLRPQPRRRREHAGRRARAVRRRGALAGVRLQPPPGLARPVDRPRPRRVRPLHPARRPVRRQRGPAGQVRPDGLPGARAGLPGDRGDAAAPGWPWSSR